MEISAKKYESVTEIFEKIVREIYLKFEKGEFEGDLSQYGITLFEKSTYSNPFIKKKYIFCCK